VKIYLDSGVFIDYLIGRGQAGSTLRSSTRRGRTPAQLLTDAETCFAAILANHVGLTSTLTLYEVEEAMYRALSASVRGMPSGDKLIVPAAREVMAQTLLTISLFKVRLVNLTPEIVNSQCSNAELQKRGVRAADALHIATALAENADIIISTDRDVTKLDGVFTAASGRALTCVDTDAAVRLI
jgi:predicted nucleic acid-binding protein